MSHTTWLKLLAKDWYLFAILVGIVGVAAYQIVAGGADEQRGEAQAVSAAPRASSGEAKYSFGRRMKSATEQERAQAVIDDHIEKFEANPQAEDAAGLLMAVGNLHMQKLGDYAQAAQYYERIMMDYPDWIGINLVYPQLVICYEKLGDETGKRWIYEKIVADYPEHTEEYKYAQKQLHLD